MDSGGFKPVTFGVGTPMLSQLNQELSREITKLVVPYESTLPSSVCLLIRTFPQRTLRSSTLQSCSRTAWRVAGAPCPAEWPPSSPATSSVSADAPWHGLGLGAGWTHSLTGPGGGERGRGEQREKRRSKQWRISSIMWCI